MLGGFSPSSHDNSTYPESQLSKVFNLTISCTLVTYCTLKIIKEKLASRLHYGMYQQLRET